MTEQIKRPSESSTASKGYTARHWRIIGTAFVAVLIGIVVVTRVLQPTASNHDATTASTQPAQSSSTNSTSPKSSNAEDWHAFSPPSGEFTVLMPGKVKIITHSGREMLNRLPDYAKGIAEKLTFTEARSTSAALHMIFAATVGPAYSGNIPLEQRLRGSEEGQLLATDNGQLRNGSERTFTVDGYPAREFVIDQGNVSPITTYRLVVVATPHRAYPFVIVTFKGLEYGSAANRFLSSIHINRNQP